ncbi:hypothetical protein WJX73_009920 [Symbiochloris irregularis]|uniref:HD domain-containing protein n=1 Tax=Symbiochloris irregularis TaxID=706552 RepID=A0AAW1P161_9CHLO
MPATGTAKESVKFLALLQNLKTSRRAGWVQKGLPDCESIADHMYRMAAMALIADEPGVDMTRCLQLAVVHDMAEAIVGDITPRDGISKPEKCRMETEAINDMQGMLGGAAGKRIRDLWQEYEDGATPEAKLVKDFDKAEMILQASEYEAISDIDLGEFFDSTEGKFQTQTGKEWAQEIRDCRKQQSKALNGK